MKRLLTPSAVVLSIAVATFALACSGAPDASQRVDPGAPPSGPTWKPVAQVLLDRCGSIDCHGSKYRNMHLYGFGSARLGSALPDAPDTTQDEADRDYDAVVGLEPDVIRQVVAEGGARPERLTFVRKARNEEAHKGGGPIVAGDDADLCILSWLASAVDADTCKNAVPRLRNP